MEKVREIISSLINHTHKQEHAFIVSINLDTSWDSIVWHKQHFLKKEHPCNKRYGLDIFMTLFYIQEWILQ